MRLPEIDDGSGFIRKLGYLPPDTTSVLLRASRTNIQTIRTNAGLTPLIPKSAWVEKDYFNGYPKDLITNQGQEGSCVAWSDVGAGGRQRFIRSGDILIPSGYFVYDQINGGRDNGAVITDSLKVMESTGAPPLSAYPKCIYKAGHNPSGVLYYKEDVAVTLAGADECATALLMGMLPQIPILVDGSFGQFTPDGVAWGGRAPRSRNSNHSVYLAGLKQIGAEWFFILVNSWGVNWGPWKLGGCLIPLAAVDNPASADDGWAHADTPAPDDKTPAPVLAV